MGSRSIRQHAREILLIFFSHWPVILHGRVLKITKYIYKNIRESYEIKKFFYPKIPKKGLPAVVLKNNRYEPKIEFGAVALL